MHPISHERKLWIEQRIKVLDACITDMSTRMMWYANKIGSNASSIDDLRNSAEMLRAERAALFVEYQVLTNLGVSE